MLPYRRTEGLPARSWGNASRSHEKRTWGPLVTEPHFHAPVAERESGLGTAFLKYPQEVNIEEKDTTPFVYWSITMVRYKKNPNHGLSLDGFIRWKLVI